MAVSHMSVGTDSSGGRTLSAVGAWQSEWSTVWRREGRPPIGHQPRGSDVSYLKSLDGLHDLSVAGDVTGDEVLGELTQLCRLVARSQGGPVRRFERLTHLERLEVDARIDVTTLVSPKMVVLRVAGWPVKDLACLEQLPALSTLRLDASPRLARLGSVRDHQAKHLFLHGNGRPIDLTGLSVAFPRLKGLYLDGFRVEPAGIDEIGALGGLERLELSNLGELASVKPLSSALAGLKSMLISGSTNVLDGRLSIFETVPYVYIDRKRRHYNYARADVAELEDLEAVEAEKDGPLWV